MTLMSVARQYRMKWQAAAAVLLGHTRLSQGADVLEAGVRGTYVRESARIQRTARHSSATEMWQDGQRE